MNPVDAPAAAASARLPAAPFSPLNQTPLGALVMRPWYDRFMLHFVARWVLPLSRAWAVALGLDGLPGGP